MSPTTSRGGFGSVKVLQSNAFAYDTATNFTKVTLSYSGTGTFAWQIGTDDNVNGTSITWEEITATVEKTLSNSDIALFWRVVGSANAILNDVKMIYS